MTTEVPQYNWRDIPERELRKGLTQRVFRGDNVVVGYNTLHSGMKTMPHSHVYEQIFMLLRGRVRLHVADQVFDLVEGSVVRIPPNVEHWAEGPEAGQEPAINMDIWTPLRPDYAAYTSYQTDVFSG
jgi:quercetin dioxygenase-like cupin family protein